MIRHGEHALLILALAANVAMADDTAGIQPARGELLYSTNCLGCHADQVHWRDKKVAKDWGSLVIEVRRWQGFSGLGWGGDDIDMVARYLNALHYHYPAPER